MVSRSMLSRSMNYNNYDCYSYRINCDNLLLAKNEKNHFHKIRTDFSPFGRCP